MSSVYPVESGKTQAFYLNMDERDFFIGVTKDCRGEEWKILLKCLIPINT